MDLSPSNSPPCLSALAVLLLLLCSLYFFFSMQKKSRKPAANLPPGPPRLPIIGNLHQLGNLPHRSMREFSKKYGPVVLLRLGRVPTLVVSSPETAKEVLKTHDLDCCSRPVSRGAKRLSYDLSDLAFGPFSDYWKQMRKLCVTELFNLKKVQSFKSVREEEVARFIDSIRQASPDPVKLTEKIFNLNNNIACKTGFGKSYGGAHFEDGEFKEIMDETMIMLSGFWGADFFPYFGWILDVFSGRRSRLEKCFSGFDAFYEKVIEQHLDPSRGNSDHEDITDVLLRLSRDETASLQLTRDHIKAMLMNVFIGGIDTSSITTEWAMTELARNPRVMKKLQAEIRNCVGRKPRVDESDLEKLQYLKMVVKETFRLHPPSIFLIPRETIGHCKIGGYDVYPKTRIWVNVWAIGRDPETWENPDEFYPERFEESEVDFRGNNFELVPFGAGRRICPGITMGVLVIELTLANLLHCFDWELPVGMKREDISIEEEAGITVHKKLPLYLVPLKYNWEDYEN